MRVLTTVRSSSRKEEAIFKSFSCILRMFTRKSEIGPSFQLDSLALGEFLAGGRGEGLLVILKEFLGLIVEELASLKLAEEKWMF